MSAAHRRALRAHATTYRRRTTPASPPRRCQHERDFDILRGGEALSLSPFNLRFTSRTRTIDAPNDMYGRGGPSYPSRGRGAGWNGRGGRGGRGGGGGPGRGGAGGAGGGGFGGQQQGGAPRQQSPPRPSQPLTTKPVTVAAKQVTLGQAAMPEPVTRPHYIVPECVGQSHWNVLGRADRASLRAGRRSLFCSRATAST